MDLENSFISTLLIKKSIDYYFGIGYFTVSVPILVKESTSNLTKPIEKNNLNHKKNLVYIGSAEQSFLEIYDPQNVNPLMALTPCYRDENLEKNTNIHFLMFLKLELFIPIKNSYNWDLETIINKSKKFFEHCNLGEEIKEVQVDNSSTHKSYDLTCKGVELGSYGYRNIEGIEYYYGTGVAEPRTSYVQRL